MKKYFGGIQGGGTCSDAVILDEAGQVISKSTGPCTNPWQTGFPACIAALGEMVIQAKKNANIDPSVPLESLGMSLSGGEMTEAQERIITGFRSDFPNASKNYHVCTDTFGSIATAFPNGGMVVISGTGSNCQLLNPSGESPRSGGWGHMLGDEGSAYWIAHSAMKTVYDHEDGFEQSALDITAVRDAIYAKFKLQTKYDILPHIYEKFSKSKIAELCKDISRLAKEQKDPLAIQIFHNAGVKLGKHVRALIPKADKDMLAESGGLKIVAVGSVMTKAWDLLKEGFMEALSSEGAEFTLVMLKEGVSSAVGGAALGAKAAGLTLNIDYSSNITQLFHYKPYTM